MYTQHQCKNLGSVVLFCNHLWGDDDRKDDDRPLGIAEPVSFRFKDLISSESLLFIENYLIYGGTLLRKTPGANL